MILVLNLKQSSLPEVAETNVSLNIDCPARSSNLILELNTDIKNNQVRICYHKMKWG